MKSQSDIRPLLTIVKAVAVVAAFILPGVRSMGQNQPPLQITSPADGTRVSPGQTITVVVTAAPGNSFSLVGLLGEDPLGTDQVATAPPFQFSLTIPATIAAARKYAIFASGATAPGQGVESDPISLDVEPSVPIKSLRVQPSQINFRSAGEQIPLTVTGTFSDGSTMDVTESSLISYSSSDTRIATVDNNGVVTAGGAGTTGILVKYGDRLVPVPVSVHAIFAGTPGSPDCQGKSVSALAQHYGGLAAAAKALGYSSVQALHDAIAAYCGR